MKKFLVGAVAALVLSGFSTPAFAYCDSRGDCTGPSANQYARQQVQRERWQSRGNNGYNNHYYDNNYGFDRLFSSPWYPESNRVKEKTARRGGVWMQDCGERIGVVPVGTTCIQYEREALRSSARRQAPAEHAGITQELHQDAQGYYTATKDARGNVISIERMVTE